jgi:type IV fimbrial biogenesis protein FimT
MVVLSLAAILLAIGIPALRNMVASGRLSDQTNDIVSAIALSRSTAITQNQQVTFCRADSNVATSCSGSAGNWQYWLVSTAAGTVVRRGALESGPLVVTSTLTADQVAFSSDGLARTNDVLVAGGPHFTICSNHSTKDNKRLITIGAGSRVSTANDSGAC